MIKPSENQKA